MDDTSSQDKHSAIRMAQQHASMMLRFPETGDYICSLRVAPFYQMMVKQQMLTITLNGVRLTNIELAPSWETYQFIVPREAQREGINRLSFKYATNSPLLDTFIETLPPYIAFDTLECVPGNVH